MPFPPDFGGCEHPSRPTLIAKRCLASTVCSTTRDAWNTGNSTTYTSVSPGCQYLHYFALHTSSPRFSRCLLSCFFTDRIRLSFILCHSSMHRPEPPSVCAFERERNEGLLNDIRANWGAEDCGQRMSRPTGLPIRRDNANSRTRCHCECCWRRG